MTILQQRGGRLVAVLFPLIMLAPTGAAAASIGTTIQSDDGGYLFRYAEFFALASKPIHILGRCESACTLALHYPDTCAGPEASFVFHSPYNAGRYNHMVRDWLMRRLPPSIRGWIRAQGGLTSRSIILEGTALRRLVRQCVT